MIEHADLSFIGKLKEGFASLVFFGVTQQSMVDLKAIATMVVVGALSAFGGAFLTARDNAFELKQYARAQEEFRIEMRQYMRESTIEVRSLADRLTRQEMLINTMQQPNGGMGGMFGMSGMNGNNAGARPR